MSSEGLVVTLGGWLSKHTPVNAPLSGVMATGEVALLIRSTRGRQRCHGWREREMEKGGGKKG